MSKKQFGCQHCCLLNIFRNNSSLDFVDSSLALSSFYFYGWRNISTSAVKTQLIVWWEGNNGSEFTGFFDLFKNLNKKSTKITAKCKNLKIMTRCILAISEPIQNCGTSLILVQHIMCTTKLIERFLSGT